MVPRKERIEKVETRSKRKRLKKKVIAPSISKTIPEGLDEEEEDGEHTNLLSKTTRVAKAMKEEKGKSLTPTRPSTQD